MSSEEQMEKVSIIVPVYRVEPYLSKCVESILNQTYPNIELILIDDGGDDRCPIMCDEYARIDARVKCIHKQNEGQSMARKVGLSIAEGDYIMYVDADDWIDLETVEICMEAVQGKNVDIVCFGYKRVYKNNVFNTSLFEGDKVVAAEETKVLHRRMIGLVGEELAHVEEADRLVTMWGKIYSKKTACLGKFISEREIGSSEDAIYNLYAFQACDKCIYLDRFFYNYRKTDNTTTTKYRKKLVEQWEVLYGYFEDYILKNKCGEDYKIALKNRVALGMLGLGLNELSSGDNVFVKSSRLKEILKRNRWTEAYNNLEFKYFPLKWKIFYGLCRYKQTELLLAMLWAISKLKSKISK